MDPLLPSNPVLTSPSLAQAALGDTGRLRWMKGCWIAIYLLGTLYNIVWDVCMDWKLQPWNCHKGVYGLRPRRMFTSQALYYVAVVVDFVLRFAWTATLVPHWFAMASTENLSAFSNIALLPIVIVSELCRRAMWVILRRPPTLPLPTDPILAVTQVGHLPPRERAPAQHRWLPPGGGGAPPL